MRGGVGSSMCHLCCLFTQTFVENSTLRIPSSSLPHLHPLNILCVILRFFVTRFPCCLWPWFRNTYGNGIDSTILFKTRTNALNLNWKKIFKNEKITCPLCQNEEETLKDLLLKCTYTFKWDQDKKYIYIYCNIKIT